MYSSPNRNRSKIRKRKVQPKSRNGLIQGLQKERDKLDMSKVNSVVESMPRRLTAVIDAKGGYSGY